jgi:type I restriction enzyme S subunit
VKDLPPGWARTTLGEATELRVASDGPTTDKFVYIIASIDTGKKRVTDPKCLAKGDAPSRARQNVRCGDVLVSLTRPNLNAVAMIGDEYDGAVASTAFHILRTRQIEPAWIYYLAQADQFIRAMSARVQGVLYPAIRPQDVCGYAVPIAPLPEQRRIVAALDEHLTRIESAIRMSGAAFHRCKLYRRAVVNAGLKDAQRLAETSAWVGSVAQLIQYGTSEKCSEESSGVAVLRMGNITMNGRLSTAKLKYLPSVCPEFPKMLLEPGDLLFNRTNSAELVGKCAVYSGLPTPCSFASYLIRVRLTPSCLPQYLAMCLNSDYGRSWIRWMHEPAGWPS